MKTIKIIISTNNNRVWIENGITIPNKCRFNDLEDFFYYCLACNIQQEIDDKFLEEINKEPAVDNQPAPC